MVVAISAERYRAICFPLSPRQKPSKYIAFVLFLSLTLELPRWFEFQLGEQLSGAQGDAVVLGTVRLDFDLGVPP